MKKNVGTILLAISCLCYSLKMNAQPHPGNFKQISIGQGLPGQNVRQVYQDHNGIIWISIEAIGLSRFDGRNFKLFSHRTNNKNSLSSNYINAIAEDKNNNLWIATENGLNRYERATKSFVKYNSDSANHSGLSNNLINTLYVDRSSNLWAGTGDGLCKYIPETDRFEKIELLSRESILSIHAIYEHTSGLFYIGTNRGLIQYNPDTQNITYWDPDKDTSNKPVHQLIRSIIEDANGNLWIATHRGISKFYVNTRTFEDWEYHASDRTDFENQGFNSTFTNDHRYIWFASYTNGIVIIDSQTGDYSRILKDDNAKSGLKSNHIRQVYEDRSGLLWVSTKFEGLFTYDKQKEIFNNLPEKYSVFQPIVNKHILAFYKDPRQDLYWVGTKFNGLYRVDMNRNKLTNFKHRVNDEQSISSNRVHDILRDKQGNIWIAMDNGLGIFNETTGKFDLVNNKYIQCIDEDIQNNIWIGTYEGVFTIDKSNYNMIRYQQNEHDLFHNDGFNVMYMYNDKLGRIWFSTRFNGIYRYNLHSNKVKHFTAGTDTFHLRDDATRAVEEDLSGKLYIGTKSKGVNIFDPQRKTFSYLNTNDGLPSNFILNIQRDQDNNLWFGTHNGLSFYDIKKDKFTNYSTVHGLQGNIFELGVNGIFDDGYLIFGGHNGLNIFHPEHIRNDEIERVDSMLITSVKVFDKEVRSDISKNTHIELKHNANYITIEFILVNYVDPLNHSFQYRMKGLSENWMELDNKNYVTFSGLQPGEYHFEVKGTNEFGVTSTQPLTIQFHINPHWTNTSWFRLLALVCISLLVFWIFRARIKQARNRRKKLEAQVHERTEKLELANTELKGQNELIERQKQEIEQHKSDLEQKVVERTKDLELAKQKAEESDKLKSAFLANMSHEIRTPLNAIMGFSSLIIDSMEESDPELEHFSQTIKTNSEMLLKIISDVLDISKIESEQIEIAKSKVQLLVVLNEALNTFQERINHSGKSSIHLYIKTSLPQNTDLVTYTDSIRLRQILFNLISNAVKFTEKGFIEIGFEYNTEEIQFFVKDTGIGIEEQYFNSIFERFIKIENVNSLYRGNGLGLSLSKSLVELLGGNIWVESIYGRALHSSLPFRQKIHIRLIYPMPSPKRKKKKSASNRQKKPSLLLKTRIPIPGTSKLCSTRQATRF